MSRGLGALLVVVSLGCAAQEPPRPAPPAWIREAPPAPQAGRPESRFPFVGVVAPRAAVDVVPRIGGRLVEVRVQLGDRVAAGDLLARLDDRAVRRTAEAAHQALAVARANARAEGARLRSARDRAERLVRLGEFATPAERGGGVLASQEAEALLQAARARSAEAALEAAQVAEDLGDTELRAPFDGVVAVRYLDAGALAGPDLPVVRIVDPLEPVLRFGVPPIVAAALATGIRIRTSAGAPGVVERIAPTVDAPSGLVFVEARLARSAAATETGSMVRVSLTP